MTLKEKLMGDYKTSIKDKDTIRKNTVIMIRSAIKQREVDTRTDLNDEDVLEIISKQLKEKRMAITEFQKGNRQDLVDLTNNEIEILLQYLPKQLTQDEVDEIVKETIEEIGAKSVKDIGLIMKSVMPKIKGMADGNMVNRAVRNIFK